MDNNNPPPPLDDQQQVEQQIQQMRKSYKLAAVSHFVGLYSHHLDFKHNVQVSDFTLLSV